MDYPAKDSGTWTVAMPGVNFYTKWTLQMISFLKAPSEWKRNIVRSETFISEGHCEEHNIYQGLLCMDCGAWICGMCGVLEHKYCRVLLVAEAKEELKKRASLKEEKKLSKGKAPKWKAKKVKEERKLTHADKTSESLKVLDLKRKKLIEELKNCEKEIQELEFLKLEDSKSCQNVEQLPMEDDDTQRDVGFSKAKDDVGGLEGEMKRVCNKKNNDRYNASWWAQETDRPLRHGPDNSHLNSGLARLEKLCKHGSLYAVETRYGGTKYGKVEVKDGRIYIYSFQEEKPALPEARFISFQELLSRFSGSTELPKTVFFQLLYKKKQEDLGYVNFMKSIPGVNFKNIYHVVDNEEEVEEVPFEIMIQTGVSLEAQNLRLVCSALKGVSYKGVKMYNDEREFTGGAFDWFCSCVEGLVWGNSFGYSTGPNLGAVYKMRDGCSDFKIQMNDPQPPASHKIGVVIEPADFRSFENFIRTGNRGYDRNRGETIISECGLVI